MCGILYAKLKSPVQSGNSFGNYFEEALEKMSYRGPDAKGIQVFENQYFGHVRLSIVDLTESSNQPFFDEDNLLIFNGEIYNFKDIDPSSKSDTHTLFNIMKTEQNPFEKLRGMFAFGWLDKKTGETTFYRDFFGEKPLYYFSNNEITVVSSTLKSIKYLLGKLGVNLQINTEAIKNDYFAFGYIRGPKTVWEGVMEVPPGHKLVVNDWECETEPLYFNIKDETYDWSSTKYIANSFISTDVPGTLLLSGGIDSTFLLSKAVEQKIPLQLGVYKADNKEIDESETALENIAKMKLDNSLFPVTVLSNAEIDALDVDGFAAILEQPSSDGLNVYNLLEYLKKMRPDLKLVYTGLGGDELFGGYPTFYNFNFIDICIKLPFVSRFLPPLKRFVEGSKILGEWNPTVYSFLYRINYGIVSSWKNKSEKLKQYYKDYLASLECIPLEAKEIYNKNSMYAIKANETFMYGTNQLIRDNDNIAMHFAFESRSPLLNIDWYNQFPDKKNRLRAFLKDKFGIVFGKKRGFTFDEIVYKESYLKQINSNKILLEQIDANLLEGIDKKNLTEIRKISILGSWLKVNSST